MNDWMGFFPFVWLLGAKPKDTEDQKRCFWKDSECAIGVGGRAGEALNVQ